MNFDGLSDQGYRDATAQAYRQFATAVPEPVIWGVMILGFGLVGGAMSRRSQGRIASAV